MNDAGILFVPGRNHLSGHMLEIFQFIFRRYRDADTAVSREFAG